MDFAPTPAPAGRGVGGQIPFHFIGQAPTGPAAPGIGLVPGQVHGRLSHRHAHQLAEALRQHAVAQLVDMARRAPSLALQPLPALRVPELLRVVATVFDELRELLEVRAGLFELVVRKVAARPNPEFQALMEAGGDVRDVEPSLVRSSAVVAVGTSGLDRHESDPRPTAFTAATANVYGTSFVRPVTATVVAAEVVVTAAWGVEPR